MIFELQEYDGCFSMDMRAETVAEAAQLARLKMNGTKEMRGIYVYADKDGTFSGSVVIGKSKKDTSELK
mgnify:FL=1